MDGISLHADQRAVAGNDLMIEDDSENHRPPRRVGDLREDEMKRMDRLNILFKLHDLDLVIIFEMKDSKYRKGKPFVVSRPVGGGSHRGERRYRRIKDAEQAALVLFNKKLSEDD
jgi:hypothetical protein